MQLLEPQRGLSIIKELNTWVSSSHSLFSFTSFLADAPILLLPLFLVILYIIGIKNKNDNYKKIALYSFVATIIAIIINIGLQKFFIKARPETVLQGVNHLLLPHLPSMSFPSDHAAVSMSFGSAIIVFIAKYLLAAKARKILSICGIFFIIASVVMSLARVAVGVHWPTDILAGWSVGLFSAYIARYIPQNIINFCISLEKKLLGYL